MGTWACSQESALPKAARLGWGAQFRPFGDHRCYALAAAEATLAVTRSALLMHVLFAILFVGALFAIAALAGLACERGDDDLTTLLYGFAKRHQ